MRLATIVAESTATGPAWNEVPVAVIFQKAGPPALSFVSCATSGLVSGGDIDFRHGVTRIPNIDTASPQEQQTEPHHQNDA